MNQYASVDVCIVHCICRSIAFDLNSILLRKSRNVAVSGFQCLTAQINHKFNMN